MDTQTQHYVSNLGTLASKYDMSTEDAEYLVDIAALIRDLDGVGVTLRASMDSFRREE